jgi:hypothetical protein
MLNDLMIVWLNDCSPGLSIIYSIRNPQFLFDFNIKYVVNYVIVNEHLLNF